MSEHPIKGDASGLHPTMARVFARLRDRMVSIARLTSVGFSYLILMACSDSSETAAQLNLPEVQPEVQPLSQQIAASEEPETSIESHSEDGHSIRFTDSNKDIWPPQPEDITDVVNITGNVSYTPVTSTHALNQGANAFPHNRRRNALIQSIVKKEDSDTKHLKREIFDYSTSQVITTHFDASGKQSIRQIKNDAQQYQPPESRAEVSRAIELAALDLLRQGYTGLNDLIGTGLLAYPTATESAASGAYFYNQRKIYVTFGHGNGELPRYRALVNLSTNSVESSGAIQ